MWQSGFSRVECRPRGFSLLELLVVLAVTSLLISLILPGFTLVRQSAYKVSCASNMHQVALGLSMYVADNRDTLPSSAYSGFRPVNGFDRMPRPQEMMVLRLSGTSNLWEPDWDGVGALYPKRYVNTPEVFYCDAHVGSHTMQKYVDLWDDPKPYRRIVGNYHYRGLIFPGPTPIERVKFATIQTNMPLLTLLSDGLRTKTDYNHISGNNTLRSDMSVTWFADQSLTIYTSLPTEQELHSGEAVTDAWAKLDRGLDDNSGNDRGETGSNRGGSKRSR